MPATSDTTAADPVVEQLADGLHVVRLPLPAVAGLTVNAYVGAGPDGVTIVDTGVGTDAPRLWAAALAACGHAPADVCRIFVTHFHPDHIGAAGPLAELTGAVVQASPATVARTPDTWGPGMAASMARIDADLRAHGVPEDLFSRMSAARQPGAWSVLLPDSMEPVEIGDALEFAGATWRLVATPGHADGHVVLVDEAGGRLLAGDHVLQRISPSIGRFPGHAVDPLGEYLDSLERTAALDADLVLPGHGPPFRGMAARCGELADHHARRLAECRAAVAAGMALDAAGPTAWQVSREVFPGVADASGQRFAIAETLAHLEHDRLRGLLAADADEDGLVRYRPA